MRQYPETPPALALAPPHDRTLTPVAPMRRFGAIADLVRRGAKFHAGWGFDDRRCQATHAATARANGKHRALCPARGLLRHALEPAQGLNLQRPRRGFRGQRGSPAR